MPCFMALCFIVLYKCLSHKVKVCGNPVMNRLCCHDFLIEFAHFLPLCHILVIVTIFQLFSLLLYLLW